MSARKDFFSGMFLFALGMVLAFKSTQLSIGSASNPKEGFFPLITAVVIMAVSLIVFASGLLAWRKNKMEIKEEPTGNANQRPNIFRVFSYSVGILLFGILMERIGFLITSSFFLLIILKYAERQTWKVTIGLGISSIALSYILFVYFLGVPLPKGFFSG